jgi:hypothetical protein
MLAIDDVKGTRGTLVVFTSNHCPHVKAWEERLIAIGDMCQINGIGVITINSGDPEINPAEHFLVMKYRARESKYPFPYVHDDTSNIARAFGATYTPEVFLFDGKGILVYHGAIDNDHRIDKAKKHYLLDAIKALIKGKPIEKAERQRPGCSINLRPSN